MDYEELLFAAKVRDIAIQLRQGERANAIKKIQNEFDDDSQDAEIASWDSQNPLVPYIARAVAELNFCAKLISELPSP